MSSVVANGAVCTCAACMAATASAAGLNAAVSQATLKPLKAITKATSAALKAAGASLFTATSTFGTAMNGATDHIDMKSATPFTLDLFGMKSKLAKAPAEFTQGAQDIPVVLAIPKPDGTLSRFKVVRSEVMDPALAAKFPEIRTYRGIGIDDPTADIRLDTTPQGFHAQVLSPGGAYFIDPYFTNDAKGTYVSHYKSDSIRTDEFTCTVLHDHSTHGGVGDDSGAANLIDLTDGEFEVSSITYGGTLRTFRTAVAGNGEYTTFHGGTVAAGQAAIVTAMSRVSGVYETELSIRLTLVANNNLLVYTNASTDPYSNSSSAINQNQTNIDAVIGNANYDIGHVFTTASGGVAGLGVVGITGQKARGTTGTPSPVGDTFTIDYVAHEIGHQFGGSHTFNSSDGGVVGQRSGATAYEPGSGSSIMAYAGLTLNDNTTNFSIPYFNHISIDEIRAHITNVVPGTGVATSNGNIAPTVSAGPNYFIPTGTPFALTATGSDGNGDTLTYDWQERNLGVAKSLAAADNGTSPLFRQFAPSTNPTRFFPQLSRILVGSPVSPNANNSTANPSERLPTVAHTAMRFRVIARDNRAGGGGVSTADMQLQVVNTGSAFLLTNFNSPLNLQGGSNQTVNWDVAGTTANGINAANVNVLLSTDGGQNFNTVLASNVPNDGSESFQLPFGVGTSTARIKVQPTNNVFFDIGNANFSIVNVPAPVSPTPAAPSLAVASDSGLFDSDRITQVNTGLSFSIGNTVAGAAVELLADGIVVGTATASGTTTNIVVSSTLADGVRSFTARQTSGGAPVSVASGATAVTIDTVASTTPPVLELADASDTGESADDGVTNDTTPTLAVSGVADNYYRFRRNGVVIGSQYDTAASVTDSPLADGTYVFNVEPVDVAGNVSAATTSITVRIDTVAPALVADTDRFDFEEGQTLDFDFDEADVLPGSINAGDFVVTSSDGSVVPALVAFDPATGVVMLSFASLLPDDNYQVTLIDGGGTGGVTDRAGNAVATETTSFFVLAGDADRNRTVDFQDLVVLAQNYNLTDKTFSQGDFDYSPDGAVDFQDLVILAQQYNKTLLPLRPAAAPLSAGTTAGKPQNRKPVAADVLA